MAAFIGMIFGYVFLPSVPKEILMVIHREREQVYEDDAPATYVARDVPAATPWSPVQIIGLIGGVAFAVLGIVAVARTGFNTSHIYTPRTTVWQLPHTPLLAVIEIGWGVLMILASVVPGGFRTLMGLLGAAALVLGIVVLAGPSHRLVHWLAVDHTSGVVYTVVGAVVALAAIVSPVFFTGTRRQEVRRVRTFE
jgi:hypothetical protein